MSVRALHDYESLTDLELAACVARREPMAVRLVTTRNNQRLFRAAWSILRNRTDAEDAVQEAYIRAFHAMGTFSGASALSTWLTRIVLNEALTRKRAAQRRNAALNSSSVLVMDEYREKLMGSLERKTTPEAAIMRKELSVVLENAIAQLPEKFRTVFVLREIERMSIEETAQALDLLPDTVKTRFLRARKRLQRMLDPELRNALGETFPFAGANCEALTEKVLQRLGHSAGDQQGG